MESREEIKIVDRNTQDMSGDRIKSQTRIKKTESSGDATSVITRILYLAYGILASLLGIRIVLSLLAANRSNAFADFIYSITSPFVSPFRTLFGIDTAIGNSGSRLELETAVAIIVYGLLAWVIAKIININNANGIDA